MVKALKYMAKKYISSLSKVNKLRVKFALSKKKINNLSININNLINARI